MNYYLRNILLTIVFAGLCQFNYVVKAENITISPASLITTSGEKLKEGDILYFKVNTGTPKIKEGDIVTGTITTYEPNGFAGQNAILIIENFMAEKTNEKLSGLIYCSGNEHNQIMEFLSDSSINPLVRGGEVKILPEEIFSFSTKDETLPQPKISLSIIPDQKIATTHDKIEVGDAIRFKVLNDVYKNNKLLVKKDTPIVGIVDHLSANGWEHDNAEITFKKFKTRDINSNIISINSDLKINGFEELKNLYPKKERFFQYLGLVWRGKEIDIDPAADTCNFNLWLEN